MQFNKYPDLKDKHAYLSASKYHWIRYTDEKFDNSYKLHLAAQRGTELHNFASEAIRLNVRLKGNTQTIAMYVNDAIGFRMVPEQTLFYSIYCFGTCDAISFRRNVLRIHDLKTGTSKASMDQLMVYAALFCLEYEVKPGEIEIHLRIYQNDDILIFNPEPDDILHIMDRIVYLDKKIQRIRLEQLG